MTVVISEAFKAFRSAGVPEDKAHEAAAALAAKNLATNKDIQEMHSGDEGRSTSAFLDDRFQPGLHGSDSLESVLPTQSADRKQ